MAFRLQTPVVFLIFNRPGLTQKTWKAISQMKPPVLFIVADGPRASRPDDAQNCAQTRKIVEAIDWPCQVHRNYAEQNMGCKKRVSSGISWAFEHTEQAMIIEDDCLVGEPYFEFCQELLERYRNDPRVMMISGDPHGGPAPRGDSSYRFTRWPHIWGWATWKRAWKFYDVAMTAWPEFRDQGRLKDALRQPASVRRWQRTFQAAYENRIDTWDFQWDFALLTQGGLSIQPRANLVTNIGFGSDATHTRFWSRHAERPLEPISFPLQHPSFVIPDDASDDRTQKRESNRLRNAFERILNLTKKFD